MRLATAQSVVVTGTSTGIGFATVQHLHSLGFRVFASVRRAADGEALQERISPDIVPLVFDVTDEAAVAAAAEAVEDEVGETGLQGLVNNAGIAISAPVEFLPLDDLRRQIEVNVIGQVAVTKAFLSALRQGKGRVVFTGSISGRVSLPLLSPYAISKHALEALCDSLRAELAPWGICVSLVEPGCIHTPIWDKSIQAGDAYFESLPGQAQRLYGPMMRSIREMSIEAGKKGIPPERVAKVIAGALTARHPKSRYLVGTDAKLGAFAKKWIPDRLFDRIIRLQARI